MNQLSGKQVRFLRSRGHHLQPVVMIGKEEINDALLATVEESLDAHELIKVKLQEGCLLDRREAADIIAGASGATVVQVLGKTILLYRRSDKEKIELP